MPQSIPSKTENFILAKKDVCPKSSVQLVTDFAAKCSRKDSVWSWGKSLRWYIIISWKIFPCLGEFQERERNGKGMMYIYEQDIFFKFMVPSVWVNLRVIWDAVFQGLVILFLFSAENLFFWSESCTSFSRQSFRSESISALNPRWMVTVSFDTF